MRSTSSTLIRAMALFSSTRTYS